MLTVDAALAAILEHVQSFAPNACPLSDALGLTLAEEIVSGQDSPPFDKALMDGYAVRSVDVRSGTATLDVIEEITAGRTPTKPIEAGQATRIMTGAPIPDGADVVVRVEHSNFAEDANQVHLETTDQSPGTSILRRGAAMKSGETILPAGRVLGPQEIGVLAELGQARVSVYRRPKVAVLATGDELVPIDETPRPGQIRNSNETMLCAQLRRAGAEPVPLGIARDDREDLAAKIREGLKADILILSGGVSAGKLDLVPSELEAAGVREVFHKVRVKPGKPIWFGVLDEDGKDVKSGASRRFVFGLPGNPVSSMVCFELFARTAIRRLMNIDHPEPLQKTGQITINFQHSGDRPTYHPAKIHWTVAGPRIIPLPWQGSADLRATADANALAVFPAGDKSYQQGDIIGFVQL
ncbi:molybdopterin molybdotransferase MoeA [Thalassoroseus pseudoceratinae]|uniref:molybdopterin molybdotransferase MoeA n=1 Tax=Thalassoroseus pseudoceratinae TaxID=2713176 RepID=UPI001421EACF|nr:gephyrin-like molybdotransferase Glp [Thalassoroseus pseudoceratinae]